MSAFMVEDQTINAVVNWLGSEIRMLSYIPSKLQELGIDTEKADWKEKLGQAMFLLNFDGVESRYEKGEAKSFRPLNYQYRVTPSVPLVQVLKSLQCWLYQCCKGNVPETKLSINTLIMRYRSISWKRSLTDFRSITVQSGDKIGVSVLPAYLIESGTPERNER